jgi:acyl-CoA thioesterase-1
MFFHLFLTFRTRLLNQLFVSLLACCFVAWSPQVFAANPKILIFGDSLSAAYGLPQQQGWASLLQKKLNEQQYRYDVVNASVSGETTSGGLSRLNTAIAETQAAIIILELGANDGLRGLPLNAMNANLSAMIKQSKKSKAKVLLLGMRIPPNYGPRYAQSFSLTYSQLSKDHNISLVPFMLENVAAKPDLIQQDGLHPNALGQPIILDNIWPHLKSLLKKQGA